MGAYEEIGQYPARTGVPRLAPAVPGIGAVSGARGTPHLLAKVPVVLGLRGEDYERMTQSHALPSLTSEDLGRLIEGGLTKERPEWVREVRRWARRALSQEE